jgi:hypothetical protein
MDGLHEVIPVSLKSLQLQISEQQLGGAHLWRQVRISAAPSTVLWASSWLSSATSDKCLDSISIGHDRWLPNPLQFIYHRTPRRRTVWMWQCRKVTQILSFGAGAEHPQRNFLRLGWKTKFHTHTKLKFSQWRVLSGRRAIAQAVRRRLPGFELRSGRVEFVVDKVAMGQVFSGYFGFSCQFSFHRLLHIHHLSSGADAVVQLVADIPSGLSQSQPQETNKKLRLHSGIMTPCSLLER